MSSAALCLSTRRASGTRWNCGKANPVLEVGGPWRCVRSKSSTCSFPDPTLGDLGATLALVRHPIARKCPTEYRASGDAIEIMPHAGFRIADDGTCLARARDHGSQWGAPAVSGKFRLPSE
jgi:hypothetical protein